MNTIALRQKFKADANHTIHVTLPPEMGDDVEVIVFPIKENEKTIPLESLELSKLMDESGFVKNVLNSIEEDCWNEL
jgi:hypothetical protein